MQTLLQGPGSNDIMRLSRQTWMNEKVAAPVETLPDS